MNQYLVAKKPSKWWWLVFVSCFIYCVSDVLYGEWGGGIRAFIVDVSVCLVGVFAFRRINPQQPQVKCPHCGYWNYTAHLNNLPALSEIQCCQCNNIFLKPEA